MGAKKKSDAIRPYQDRLKGNLDIEHRNKYQQKYVKENYSKAEVILKKQEKEIFKKYASENGYDSLSAFFKESALKAHPALKKLLKAL